MSRPLHSYNRRRKRKPYIYSSVRHALRAWWRYRDAAIEHAHRAIVDNVTLATYIIPASNVSMDRFKTAIDDWPTPPPSSAPAS
jgi:hypothetical protein